MFQTNRAKNIPTKQTRAGFTLIELLVTISIIAILASIILPAVNNARRAARVAAVRAEMKQIEAALEQFKADFGMYPPSGITLYERTSDFNSHPTDKYLISKLWPNFDFNLPRDKNSNGNSTDPGEFIDINNNGVFTDAVTLTPSECLVFFLGGMISSEASVGVNYVQGFSADPTNPFTRTASGKKYFDFSNDRLKKQSGHEIPSYVDNYPQQEKPIVYFSNIGSGYNSSHAVSVGMHDVYRQTWSFNLTNTSLVFLNPASDTPARKLLDWQGDSFQLVSPGPDGAYGAGGYFATGMKRPVGTTPAWAIADDVWSEFTKLRNADIDNITNFNNGELR